MLSVHSANSKVALTTVPLCTISKEQLCNLTVSGGLENGDTSYCGQAAKYGMGDEQPYFWNTISTQRALSLEKTAREYPICCTQFI
jgi:hypothetical protein